MIYLKSDYSSPEGIDSYNSITGVNSPELMYNYFLSPKKNLLRSSPFFASILSNLSGTKIKFQSAAKSGNLQTIDLTGFTVKESDNIEVNTIKTNALFYPIEVTFKADAPINLQSLLQINSRGSLTFKYFGNTYKGFILDCSQDVSRNTSKEFKLLLSSSCDITKLIR